MILFREGELVYCKKYESIFRNPRAPLTKNLLFFFQDRFCHPYLTWLDEDGQALGDLLTG